MPSQSAFGLDMPSETPEADPFADAPVIEGESDQQDSLAEDTGGDGTDPLAAPAEEESDPALDEGEATPEAEEEATEEATTEEEATEEEEPDKTPYEGRYSTKYKTVEDFEEAHRNALDLGQRQAERARTAEQQLAQATAYLEAAAAYIADQEAKSKQAPAAQPDIEVEAAKYGVDAETLQLARTIAAQEAEAKVAPLQAQLSQQEQMAQLAAEQAELVRVEAEARVAINAFRAAHPDLDADTENEIVAVFHEFGLETTLPEVYDVALEMAQSPELRKFLRVNPQYLDTDEGMEIARRLSGVKTVTKAKPRTRDLTDARKKATVESGSLGAPPAGEEVDRDEWDDVLDVARGGRTKSVFGV